MRKRNILIILLLLSLCSCAATPLAEVRARVILSRLTPEQRVDQLFMVSISGNSRLSGAEERFLRRCQPGAILLFGFNVSGSVQDTRALTASVQESLAKTPLPALVAIDHEGGLVYRFGSKLTPLPSAAKVGRALTPGQTETLGKIAGSQLRALGISVNLAPIAEPLGKWNRPFLESRAYSDDPALCVRHAAAFARGLRRGGAAATLKHFPGNASADPHKGLPVWDLSDKEVNRYGIDLFRKTIRLSKPSLVMLSHVMVPALDSTLPASLSPGIIRILRNRLGFGGIIISDDMVMRALASRWSMRQSAVMTLRAGSDMMIISSRADYLEARQAVLSALASGELSRRDLDNSVLRIIRLKISLGLWAERSEIARKIRFSSLKKSVPAGAKFIDKHFGKGGR